MYIDKKAGHEEHDVSCQFLIGNVYLKLYCVEEEITSEEVSIPYR